MKPLYQWVVKNLLHFDNFLYRLTSLCAIKAERGLHPKHRLMNYHSFFLDHICANDVVLDIGCGNGALAFDLARKAKRVIAIDTNTKHLPSWQGPYAAQNLVYEVANAITYQPQETINVIVLSNILEHLKDRNEFLQQIKHLAPTLLIRVPMINRDWITLYKKELGVVYKLDKTHFIEYTLNTFADELTSAGLFLNEYSIQFGEIWSVVNKQHE